MIRLLTFMMCSILMWCVWRCVGRCGVMWYGVVWRGVAWRGVVWYDMAYQLRNLQTSFS